jgi:hypothetical protein
MRLDFRRIIIVVKEYRHASPLRHFSLSFILPSFLYSPRFNIFPHTKGRSHRITPADRPSVISNLRAIPSDPGSIAVFVLLLRTVDSSHLHTPGFAALHPGLQYRSPLHVWIGVGLIWWSKNTGLGSSVIFCHSKPPV